MNGWLIFAILCVPAALCVIAGVTAGYARGLQVGRRERKSARVQVSPGRAFVGDLEVIVHHQTALTPDAAEALGLVAFK